MKIRGARIRVVDRDGEEFEKAARGSVAGGRDGRPPCFINRQGAGFERHKGSGFGSIILKGAVCISVFNYSLRFFSFHTIGISADLDNGTTL
jgi:hypothetical protein